MGRLIRMEMKRAFARRLVRVMLGAFILGMLTAGTIAFFKSSRDIAGATSRHRAAAVESHERCLRGEEGPPPEELELRGVDRQGFCRSEFPADATYDPRLHLSDLLEAFRGTSAIMILLGLLIGASFIGAEWQQRTMATTVSWEPRRHRVWAAKVVGCAVVVFAGVIVVDLLIAAALLPAALFRGTTVGIDAGWFRTASGTVLRGATVAALASGIGAALAMIGRHTVAAVGVVYGYLAVLEGIMRGLKPHWQRWLLGDNAAMFVVGSNLDGAVNPRSTAGSGILLSMYTLGILGVALWQFRRRDLSA